jgi:quinol monooxygenase YgiN
VRRSRPGAIAHFAGPIPSGGWRVVDVWESQAAAGAFYGSEAFMAVVAQAGDAMATSPWPIYRAEIERALKQAD